MTDTLVDCVDNFFIVGQDEDIGNIVVVDDLITQTVNLTENVLSFVKNDFLTKIGASIMNLSEKIQIGLRKNFRIILALVLIWSCLYLVKIILPEDLSSIVKEFIQLPFK